MLIALQTGGFLAEKETESCNQEILLSLGKFS